LTHHEPQDEPEEEIFEIKPKGTGEDGWRRVTKAEWIHAERSAGFRPRMSSTDPRYWTTCATAQFSSSESYSGRRSSKD
jgi:hypothetical protein